MRWNEIMEKTYVVLLKPQDVLVEGNHIQQVKNAILVNQDFYTFLKMAQRVFGGNFQKDNNYNRNLIACYDPIQYDIIKQGLEKVGISFEEVDDVNLIDNELFPNDNNNKSPYPSNDKKQSFW